MPATYHLKHVIVFLTVFWLFPLQNDAQELSKSSFIKVANLEGIKVICLLKDAHGFMWIGTEVGLYRYDGYSTQLINSTTSGIYLSSNLVMTLYEDRETNLWIGTDNGINKLSADRKSMKAFLTVNNIAAPSKNNFKAITETYDGTIWCSSVDGMLYRAPDKDHFSFVTKISFKVKGPLVPLVNHL